ncbi:MAG: inositol monophosphatase family protein [Vicinamibacterales bacterium]
MTRLVRQVGSELVVPRFRALGAGDVLQKMTPGDIDDVVTVVDHEAEEALTAGLREIADVPVVGEEAAAADPSILRRLDDERPVWIVDPLDGTKNFAAGEDGFGIMVSYVERRHARAAWIHLPVRRETFVASAGSGACLNGQRVRVPLETAAGRPAGTVFIRFMPSDARDRVMARLDGHYTPAEQNGAAAVEYTDVLRGHKDFVLYYRLLPWDHGAPALIPDRSGRRRLSSRRQRVLRGVAESGDDRGCARGHRTHASNMDWRRSVTAWRPQHSTPLSAHAAH